MSLDEAELARRLRMARDGIGMTQEQVAAAIGVSRPAVAQIEAGKRTVSGIELYKLSDLYRKDMGELLGPRSAADDGTRRLVRNDNGDVTPRMVEAIETCMAWDRELVGIERRVGVVRPATVAYDLRASNPRRAEIVQGVRAADDERTRSGLGNLLPNDLVGLMEGNGVRSIGFPMANDVRGLTVIEEGASPLVIVNATHGVFMQRLALAHGYGHVLLDPSAGLAIDFLSKNVSIGHARASAFSEAFLMPVANLARMLADIGKGPSAASLVDIDPRGRAPGRSEPSPPVRLHDLVLLAHAFMVPPSAMLERLTSLRCLSQREAQELRRGIAEAGQGMAKLLGLTEPTHDQGRKHSDARIVRLALEAVDRSAVDMAIVHRVLARHRGLGLEEILTGLKGAGYD